MLPQRMLPRPGSVPATQPGPAAGMAPSPHMTNAPSPAVQQRPVMGTNMGEVGVPWNFRFAKR